MVGGHNVYGFGGIHLVDMWPYGCFIFILFLLLFINADTNLTANLTTMVTIHL